MEFRLRIEQGFVHDAAVYCLQLASRRAGPPLALVIFTLAAGLLFHDFWNADAASKLIQSIHFWKSVSISGGMLMAFAFSPGRYSVDRS